LRSANAAEQSQQKQSERPDKSVRSVTRINGNRIRFADLARFAWPTKTEFHLAHLVRVDPRTARRWLADDNEPPAEALGVVLAEIMKRYHQRG
jgi:hypothetical protein